MAFHKGTARASEHLLACSGFSSGRKAGRKLGKALHTAAISPMASKEMQQSQGAATHQPPSATRSCLCLGDQLLWAQTPKPLTETSTIKVSSVAQGSTRCWAWSWNSPNPSSGSSEPNNHGCFCTKHFVLFYTRAGAGGFQLSFEVQEGWKRPQPFFPLLSILSDSDFQRIHPKDSYE